MIKLIHNKCTFGLPYRTKNSAVFRGTGCGKGRQCFLNHYLGDGIVYFVNTIYCIATYPRRIVLPSFDHFNPSEQRPCVMQHALTREDILLVSCFDERFFFFFFSKITLPISTIFKGETLNYKMVAVDEFYQSNLGLPWCLGVSFPLLLVVLHSNHIVAKSAKRRPAWGDTCTQAKKRQGQPFITMIMVVLFNKITILKYLPFPKQRW